MEFLKPELFKNDFLHLEYPSVFIHSGEKSRDQDKLHKAS